MGKKKGLESSQENQGEAVKPTRKKGASAKPTEAKKPSAKAISPKATVPAKAKASAVTTPDDQVKSVKTAKTTKTVVKKKAPKATKVAKTESPKKKIKALKKQWENADEKVAELKKAYKKLKKKDGKTKAKESFGATIRTAKALRTSLKETIKLAKKVTKKKVA